MATLKNASFHSNIMPLELGKHSNLEIRCLGFPLNILLTDPVEPRLFYKQICFPYFLIMSVIHIRVRDKNQKIQNISFIGKSLDLAKGEVSRRFTCY